MAGAGEAVAGDAGDGGTRRHFADRQALLDALAEAGFTRPADQVRATAGPSPLRAWIARQSQQFRAIRFTPNYHLMPDA